MRLVYLTFLSRYKSVAHSISTNKLTIASLKFSIQIKTNFPFSTL